jgi:hypothetical protein
MIAGWDRKALACAAGLALIAALSTGCATAGVGGGGWPGPGLPPDVDAEVLEEGAKAEAARAVAEVWAVASGVREVGARLSFTFWFEHGALTLTEYKASGRGGAWGLEVNGRTTRHALATLFRAFAQQRTGAVHVMLERREAGWDVGYVRLEEPRPSEAKTLPVRREGLPVEAVKSATEGLERVLRAVEVPEGSAAQVEVTVHLEDGRTEEWELQRVEVARRGAAGEAPKPGGPAAVEVTSVVLPFTQGVGERRVLLQLSLVRPWGSRGLGGWVEAARVERQLSSPAANAEFVAEYRLLWEDILRRWREDTKEGAEWVARRGVEELATWYAGGILTKGVGWLGIRTLPTVVSALRRGGEASAGWLRTTLSRMPGEQRQAFERLWSKVQLEGKRSLSKGEKAELRALMEGMERLVQTPLDKDTKDQLRLRARGIYKRLHPHMAEALDQRGGLLPIHHRRPLEHAHLFPEDDINGADNLIMLTREAHDRINALWTKFRRARPQATAWDVEEAARAIDARFSPWYHRVDAPPQVPYSVKEAEATALTQLQRLFPGLE